MKSQKPKKAFAFIYDGEIMECLGMAWEDHKYVEKFPHGLVEIELISDYTGVLRTYA